MDSKVKINNYLDREEQELSDIQSEEGGYLLLLICDGTPNRISSLLNR